MMNAVFLDRDGVINELVFNANTGEYEPPHYPDDLVIFPDVIESLRILQDASFKLFLVSNQPDYAKGKTTLENIHAVHTRLEQIFTAEGIHFQKFFYCYHHPKGVIPEYSFTCECRKPKPFFILQAAHDFDIDLIHSWMIGDRDSDSECGKSAGVRTISVEYTHSLQSRGSTGSDFTVANLKAAVRIILNKATNFQCE